MCVCVCVLFLFSFDMFLVYKQEFTPGENDNKMCGEGLSEVSGGSVSLLTFF